MTDDSLLPFDLPAVCRKKVTAAFDGGLISSDGGLVLLREAERRLGLVDLLANCLRWISTLPPVRTPRLTVRCEYPDPDMLPTVMSFGLSPFVRHPERP